MRFPFSLEHIPRRSGAGCLSLRAATALTALIVTVYSLLAVSEGGAQLTALSPLLSGARADVLVTFALVLCVVCVHAVSFLLSVILLLGAIREQAELVRPWLVWKCVQLVGAVLLFVFVNTAGAVGGGVGGEGALLLCAIEFLTILVRFYMLVLVSSYYRAVCEGRAEGERLKALLGHDTWYTEA